jgi:hypothetical protein
MSFECSTLDFVHRRLFALPSEAVALLGSNLRIRAFLYESVVFVATIPHSSTRMAHNKQKGPTITGRPFFFPKRLSFPVGTSTPYSHLPAGGRCGLSIRHMEQDARALSGLGRAQTMSPIVALIRTSGLRSTEMSSSSKKCPAIAGLAKKKRKPP